MSEIACSPVKKKKKEKKKEKRKKERNKMTYHAVDYIAAARLSRSKTPIPITRIQELK